ncbi:MAG: hypothetical protein JSS07_01185 [Proteobacteria bacterium]|nr:hypothetical protein [Pseudomonadota bacterium]
MSAQSFEITLARLYTDKQFRRQFLIDPQMALIQCDLTSQERKDLMNIDKAGLILASQCFSHKALKKRKHLFAYRLKTFVKKCLMINTK